MCGPGMLYGLYGFLPILQLEGLPYVLGYFLLLCVAKLKIIYSYGGNRGDFVLKLSKKKNKLEISIRYLYLSRLKSTLDGTGTCSAVPELTGIGLGLRVLYWMLLGWQEDPETLFGSVLPSALPCASSHLVKTFGVLF